jgi:hypothetical protein
MLTAGMIYSSLLSVGLSREGVGSSRCLNGFSVFVAPVLLMRLAKHHPSLVVNRLLIENRRQRHRITAHPNDLFVSSRLNFLLFKIESNIFRYPALVINKICRNLLVAHFFVVFDYFDAANATTSYQKYMPMSVGDLIIKQIVRKLIWSDGSSYLAKINQSIFNSSLVLNSNSPNE